jgi:hypothetical protein
MKDLNPNNQSFSKNNRIIWRTSPGINAAYKDQEPYMIRDYDEDVHLDMDYSGRRSRTYQTPAKKIRSYSGKNYTSIGKYENSFRNDYHPNFCNYVNPTLSDFEIERGNVEEYTRKDCNQRARLNSMHKFHKKRSSSQEFSYDYSSHNKNHNRGCLYTPPKRILKSEIPRVKYYASPDFNSCVNIKRFVN